METLEQICIINRIVRQALSLILKKASKQKTKWDNVFNSRRLNRKHFLEVALIIKDKIQLKLIIEQATLDGWSQAMNDNWNIVQVNHNICNNDWIIDHKIRYRQKKVLYLAWLQAFDETNNDIKIYEKSLELDHINDVICINSWNIIIEQLYNLTYEYALNSYQIEAREYNQNWINKYKWNNLIITKDILPKLIKMQNDALIYVQKWLNKTINIIAIKQGYIIDMTHIHNNDMSLVWGCELDEEYNISWTIVRNKT